MTNLILNVDSYKSCHWLCYPPGTTYISSYIESRGVSSDNPVAKALNIELVHFGLQMYLKEYLSKPITMGMINAAESVLKAHGLPFNREEWEYILKTYNGYMPVTIQALPEGTVIPVGTPQLQIKNIDAEVPWITSYLETSLLRAVWYPSTVATISREMKKLIYAYLKTTSDFPKENIPFKLHDFGARGVSSLESAGIGGCAHLVNFMGSDTIEGLLYARKYYNEPMAGFSIPAAEHSTITSWGIENEAKAYENMVTQFGTKGALVAVVSDSYDIYNAADKIWGQDLKDKVLSSGATVVIRPDSGDPVTVNLKLMEILAERFGYSTNSKGFKVLNPAIRIIQGDGVDYDTTTKILSAFVGGYWSTENIAFGMGGALLQKLNRDTFKYAMKANAIATESKHEWSPINKNPVTDSGKKSRAGRIAVIQDINGLPITVPDNYQDSYEDYQENLLKVVYTVGKTYKDSTFAEVRERAAIK